MNNFIVTIIHLPQTPLIKMDMKIFQKKPLRDERVFFEFSNKQIFNTITYR